MIWRDQLLDQLDFYWQYSLRPRLEGLTDAEYFWEPVPNCWSIRERAGGSLMIDWELPAPDPPPVTTIAWRLAHVAVLALGMRASNHFGDGSLTLESVTWPGSADEAVAMVESQYRSWRDGVRGLDEAALSAPVGEAEGPWAEYPFATLILHINREIMHHGAEIALLRDLYRAGYRAQR